MAGHLKPRKPSGDGRVAAINRLVPQVALAQEIGTCSAKSYGVTKSAPGTESVPGRPERTTEKRAGPDDLKASARLLFCARTVLPPACQTAHRAVPPTASLVAYPNLFLTHHVLLRRFSGQTEAGPLGCWSVRGMLLVCRDSIRETSQTVGRTALFQRTSCAMDHQEV